MTTLPIFFTGNNLIGTFIDPITYDDGISVEDKVETEKEANEIIAEKDLKDKEKMKDSKNEITEESLSSKLYDDCCRLSQGNSLVRIDFVRAALNTSKWINYAGKYMVCSGMELINNATKDQREFVNGLSVAAGFGKIYQDNDVKNLDECDSKQVSPSYTGKFLFNKDETFDILFSDKFQAAMRKRMLDSGISSNQLTVSDNVVDAVAEEKPVENTTTKSRVDENGYIHPIFTTMNFENELKAKYTGEMSDTMLPYDYMKFRDSLCAYINEFGETNYRFEHINGLFYLYILRPNNIEDYYILDNGSIVGGKDVYILANYHDYIDKMNKTIFVNADKHPDIVQNMVRSSLYFLTPEEVEEVKKEYFYDVSLYNMIDFSTGEDGDDTLTEFMDWITPEQRFKLESNLLGVRSVTGNVRFRFTSFEDEDNFTLKSEKDIQPMFPLLQMPGEVPYIVKEGMSVTVENGKLTVDDGKEVKHFQMTSVEA